MAAQARIGKRSKKVKSGAVYMITEGMIAIVAILGIHGFLIVKNPDRQRLLFIAGGLAIYLAMERGIYWSIFERGQGWFSPNRVFALAVFAAALFGPVLWKSYRSTKSVDLDKVSLEFVSGEDAFEYSRTFMQSEIRDNNETLGLVVDIIPRRDIAEGRDIFIVHVIDRKETVRITSKVHTTGYGVQVGELVAVITIFSKGYGSYTGLITARLKSQWENGMWQVIERYNQ